MVFAESQWLWLLLAVPLLAGIAAWCWRRRLKSAARWSSRGLWDRVMPGHDPARIAASVVLFGIALAGVALALAQPRWGTGEQQVERQGVDIVFVLDTSLSMATRDVLPNRLWVAQTLVRQMAQDLPGHRVALVQAEGDGVVMVPLTSDVAVLDLLLDAVQPGSLPTPGTEMAPALERSLELFPEGDGKHRVIVLLSDGENHGRRLEEAAEKLRDNGTVVHTVGIGTRDGKPLELPEAATGAALAYKTDEDGQVVVSRLIEESLETLSRKTGGHYLRAEGAATDLRPIVSRIEAMEQRSYGSETINTLEERFQWPLALALLALGLHLALSPFRPAQSGGAP